MFFISCKNIVWFLSYVILKFTISGFPIKIVNLPFRIDVGYKTANSNTKYKLKIPTLKMQNKLKKRKTRKIKHHKLYKLRTKKGPSTK